LTIVKNMTRREQCDLTLLYSGSYCHNRCWL